MSKQKIIIICGPTAVGKTALAVDLCRKLDGELISADSQQVYRGMDVGTAKDDLSGQGVRCHLIDVTDPDQPFDAAQFKELADNVIVDVVSRGKVPIVVGGTGFYIKVLLEGLSEAPARDENLREELAGIEKEQGREALFEILKKEDPASAAKLHTNDISRVVRAIEVKRMTGKSITEFNEEQKKREDYDAVKICLNIDRSELYKRIDERVDKMIERGLEDEVKNLVEKYGPDIQSLKAVGYKEIVNYLSGNISLEDAINLTKRDSRRFAKRQLTWFRGDPKMLWFSPDDREKILKKVR